MKKSQKGSRDKICKAALSLFTKSGIKATTTKQIAREAGISEGTIYIYFKSKDELAYELFAEHMFGFRNELLGAVSGADDSTTELKNLITAFYHYARNEPVKYAYINIGHSTELKKLDKDFEKPKDVFVKMIETGVQKSYFRKIDPNIAASYIIGMITRSIMFFNNGMIHCSYDELVCQTVESSKAILAKN